MTALTKSTLKFSKLLLLALFLALAPAALASTWYVDGMNGNDSNNCQSWKHACKTIGHAISLASAGDTIGVAAATYTENLTISISLNIIGSGAKTTIVDGSQAGTVFIISGAPVVLSKLTIQNGSSDFAGGGVANYGTLTIDKSTITRNVAVNFGGGVYNEGTLTINNSTISGNSLSYEYGSGGGILNWGTLTVNRGTITANIGYDGGGVDSGGGAVAINSSTLSGNGGTWGGGICISGGTGTINNSTITANSASGDGGGILNYGTLTINNGTIAGNSAPAGGGITQITAYGGSVTFQNSVIANNSGGNCLSTMTSNGYNLSDDNTCNFTGPSDMNNTEPKLGTLGYHGGPTQTIPELTKSPTVDAGNPNGCTDGNGNLLTADQRGFPRPGAHKQDKRCDMGAFERQTD